MTFVIPQIISSILDCQIPNEIRQRILSDKLEFYGLSSGEFENYILEFIKYLNQDLLISGKHRQEDWENGWKENLEEYRQTRILENLIPKYYNKYNIARLNGKIIQTITPWFDYYLNSYFVDSIIFPYIEKPCILVEVGCGTGHHLFRFNEYFPHNEYIGADWVETSQQIIEEVGLKNVRGKKFDCFSPANLGLNNTILLTVASLEQVGNKYRQFLEYVLDEKPSLCIHFEPIIEVLDENNLVDYLTIKHFTRRGYLQGFLPTLQLLENLGKIQIQKVQRLYYGSKFVEGHTLIIWKPL